MSQYDLSFDCTAAERLAVRKIAKRAVALIAKHGSERRGQIEFEMDMIAAHANGCPVDFEKLLSADDFNLAHDVFGIERHLNRETGALENFFLPRCAKKTLVEAA